jgi:GT2 family glycosyltransferase
VTATVSAGDCPVLAVIVNWNSSPDTLECVDHLRLLYPRLPILVVDNGSVDSDRAMLRAGLPRDVDLVISQENRGYAHGINQGLLAGKGRGFRWTWWINPDSRPRPGCLETLLSHSEGALALSPAQASSPSYAQGDEVYLTAASIRRGRVTPVICEGCSAGVHAVDVVTGTSLLVDVQAAYGVGLLDETYFHYKEEYDVLERIGRLGPVRLVCIARTWHRRGASLAHESAAAQYYRVRNELLYLRRRRRTWAVAPRTGRLVVRTLWGIVRPGAARKVREATYRGLTHGLRGRGGPMVPIA